MSVLEQFKDQYYNYDDFERAITTAMKELNITRFRAMNELMFYMTQHGSVEDFKNYINYFVAHQDNVEED